MVGGGEIQNNINGNPITLPAHLGLLSSFHPSWWSCAEAVASTATEPGFESRLAPVESKQ